MKGDFSRLPPRREALQRRLDAAGARPARPGLERAAPDRRGARPRRPARPGGRERRARLGPRLPHPRPRRRPLRRRRAAESWTPSWTSPFPAARSPWRSASWWRRTTAACVVVEIEGFLVLWIDAAGPPRLPPGGAARAPRSPRPSRSRAGCPSSSPPRTTGAWRCCTWTAARWPPPPCARWPRPARRGRLRLGGAGGRAAPCSTASAARWTRCACGATRAPPSQVRDASGRTLSGREPKGWPPTSRWTRVTETTAATTVSGRHGTARPAGERQRVAGCAGSRTRSPSAAGASTWTASGARRTPRCPSRAQPDLPGASSPRTPGATWCTWTCGSATCRAAEDPDIREVALGGLDTTGRTRTVWQVKHAELGEDEEWRDALRRLQRGPPPGHVGPAHSSPGSPGHGKPAVPGGGVRRGRPLRLSPPRRRNGARRARGVRRARREGRRHPAPCAPTACAGTSCAWASWWSSSPGLRTRAKQPGTLARVTKVEPAAAGDRLQRHPFPATWPPPTTRGCAPVASFLWSADNGFLAYAVRQLDRAGGGGGAGGGGPRRGCSSSPGRPGGALRRAHGAAGPPRGAALREARSTCHSETVTLDSPVPEHAQGGDDGRLLRRAPPRWRRSRVGERRRPSPSAPTSGRRWPTGWRCASRAPPSAPPTTGPFPVRMAAPTRDRVARTREKRPLPLPPRGIEHRYAALATVHVQPHRHHRARPPRPRPRPPLASSSRSPRSRATRARRTSAAARRRARRSRSPPRPRASSP
jgi:hypothetical protein